MTYCRLFSCSVLLAGHLVLLDTILRIRQGILQVLPRWIMVTDDKPDFTMSSATSWAVNDQVSHVTGVSKEECNTSIGGTNYDSAFARPLGSIFILC